MPNHWKTYKLSEVFNIIGGGTPRTTIAEYWDGDIPWLSVVDFNNDQRSVFSTEKSITQLGLEKSSTKLLKVGQLIISARGTVGQLAQLGRDMAFNQSCYGLDGVSSKLNNDFGYYLLKHSVSSIQSNAHGSVFDTITRNTFDNIEAAIPPLHEQQAIAAILSSLDDKIELNLQMNKTLEEMAMNLYKHWFVDFGPFKDGKFVDSELGLIPEGWEVKGILEIVDLLSGGTPKTTMDEYWNGDICWVSAKDIGNGGLYINDTEKKITELGVSKSATKILPEDTVILVARGSVGKYGMIAKKMAMNQSCYGLFAKGKYSQGLVYLMFSELIEQFKRMAYGSVFDTITTSTFKSTNVVVPPTSIIENVKTQIDPLFDQLKQNVLENESLTALRDTLLPKLISGAIRVKDIEQSLASIM
jgi:type I restriction enzyme S subunit